MNASIIPVEQISFPYKYYESEYYEEEVSYSFNQHLQYFLTSSILSSFFCGLLSTFGILGNILTVMVLVKHGSFSDTTNILLTSIAACDLVYLSADIVTYLHRVLMRIDHNMGQHFEEMYLKSYAPVHNIALIIGIFQVAVIAVERLVAVVFPFAVSRIFTPFNVKAIIAFIVLYTIAFTLPNYFLVNKSVIMSGDDAIFAGDKYFLFIINTVFLYLLPMFIILFSNLAIGVSLHLSSVKLRAQKSVTNSLKRQKELKLFKMLFIVFCVAFLSFFPRIFLSFGFFLEHDLSYSYKRIIFNTCFHIYTSTNFIIYVTMSSKFTKAFRQLICGNVNG